MNDEAIFKSLRLLENDADALGWDAPAKLYGITGDEDDPDMELVSEVPGHPAESLEELYDNGRRPPVNYHGLALLVEGWRSITLEEAEEAGLINLDKEREAHKDDWDEWFPEASEAFVDNLMRQADGSVSALPEKYRKETRNIIAVFRDGTCYSVNRDRGGEIWTNKAELSADQLGRVPEALYRLLEPMTLSPDETWVVAHRLDDEGTLGDIIEKFPTEFDAQRKYLSLPGHGAGKFVYMPESVYHKDKEGN